jgi:sortase (surface protein transpeptidase)
MPTVRPAAATAVLGLALAVGTPATWGLTRPPTAAGAPVAQVLAAAPAHPDRAGAPAVTGRDTAPAPIFPVPAPARLVVPDLGVDAPVDPVGVAADGQMGIPPDVGHVGWYRFGPSPGAPGHAVLAGHVDDREQGLGALVPLRAAAAGAEVRVTDTAGTTTRWRVMSRELIGKPDLPLDALFARAGAPRLVLITCGGPFLPERGSYRDAVVVVAEPA